MERYIDGRELYVGILGNARLQVFPVWELLFTKAPEEAPRIATEKVKWDAAYRTRTASRPISPRALPDALVAQHPQPLQAHLPRARAVGLRPHRPATRPRGQDLRPRGQPQPAARADEDFAESAREAGVEYDGLLQRIVNLALQFEPSQLG